MVEVFRTNIDSEKKANLILEKLSKAFPDYKINFDLEDCDNILRVENRKGQIDANGIREIVIDFGFSAEVLPDIPVLGDHYKATQLNK